MKISPYQTPELRNESDAVIQVGTYGKYTPFANADNTGILDYINNNLEALKNALSGAYVYVKNKSSLPASGDVTKIYVTQDDGKSYKWTGTEWSLLTSQLNGLSAYEIAQSLGFTGTEEEWITSLGTDTISSATVDDDGYLTMHMKGGGEIKTPLQPIIDCIKYRDTATLQAQNASNSATSAANSEKASSVSEGNAKTSADNAKVSETNANTSAKQSATSATNSEASNQQSKKWASATESPDGAVDTDSPTGKTQSSRSWALYSKDRSDSAASSATASANSATEAATHEANAKQSLVASQNIQKEVEDGLKKVSSVVTYRGTVDSFADLPTELTADNTGDMYNIKNAGGADSSGDEIKAGDNVVWNGSGWDDQSGHVDLSDYYTKEEIGKSVLSVVANNDTLTFIHRDATKDSLTINNVGHATKASQDGNGNDIVTTYETKSSHASDINSINNTIGTKCLSSLTVTDASITATTVDGTKSTATVNNVGHATKASQDDKGQAIDVAALKSLITTTVNNAVLQCKKDLYPVGSVYVSITDSRNPADILGFGTWEALPAGYGLVAQGTATAEDGSTLTFTAGQKSGEFKHQLSVGEMPTQSPYSLRSVYQDRGLSTASASTDNGPYAGRVVVSTGGDEGKSVLYGGGSRFKVVQPCISSYIWKRIA